MKIILASHGALAESLLEVVRMILGDEDDAEAFCLNTYETPSEIAARVKEKVDAERGEPVILVADIRGGSVFNNLLPLCENPAVTLIAGMNLDLVLALVNMEPKTQEELAEVMKIAKDAIVRFDKDILASISRQDSNEKGDGLW